MALKAVHVSDVPNLDQVPSLSLYATRCSPPQGLEVIETISKSQLLLIGHRGHGMNMSQSTDPRFKSIKENTLSSFNAAAKHPIHYVEFDVQVTKDDCPIIFHDDFIYSQHNDGMPYGNRVTDLTLSEFLSYGPQKEQAKIGKPLLRKTKDGKIINWDVQADDTSCTLQEAFQNVNPSLGFNIELKFDDNIVYQQDHLIHVLQVILRVVFENAKERPIIFSSFQPDAALLVKKLQNIYPVYFLTNAGNEIYSDARRNSLEEAIKVCLEGGLEGIVSEVRGIFRNPGTVSKIKEAKLSLLTYGKLNNVAEAVYMQHLMGVEGVIVDLVSEISEAVSDMLKQPSTSSTDEKKIQDKPQFSERELSFLLKLIPELIQQ